MAITAVGKHLTSSDEVVRLLRTIVEQNATMATAMATLIQLEQAKLEQLRYQSNKLHAIDSNTHIV